MNNISHFLNNLGLSDTEIKVYFVGLKLGPAKASHIAQLANISRTLTYHALTSLEAKGLAARNDKRHSALFEMEPALTLKEVAEKKQQEFADTVNQMDSVVAQINAELAATQQARLVSYQGSAALKQIALEILDTKERVVRTLSPVKEVFDLVDPSFLKDWFAEIRKQKISSKSLWTTNNIDPQFQNQLRNLRLVPKGLIIQGTMMMYDSTMVFFSTQPPITTIKIENESYIETLKALFDFVWDQSQAPE